ncbi:hypothetical protein BC829DRAFT_417569 [Chytridium lagenaria]|nr:hypothetical protein BC829DRAFT_417569 [Chytridium lagenaria]
MEENNTNLLPIILPIVLIILLAIAAILSFLYCTRNRHPPGSLRRSDLNDDFIRQIAIPQVPERHIEPAALPTYAEPNTATVTVDPVQLRYNGDRLPPPDYGMELREVDGRESEGKGYVDAMVCCDVGRIDDDG